ncbi:MAG: hypothetical protein ACI4P4_00240, partial [Faecousia sp.]
MGLSAVSIASSYIFRGKTNSSVTFDYVLIGFTVKVLKTMVKIKHFGDFHFSWCCIQHGHLLSRLINWNLAHWREAQS